MKMATTNPSAIVWESQFAREVQERISPSTRPWIPNLDYHSDARRAQGVNGDYLDYFEVDGGNLCLAIGDVAGRGLQTTLLTATLHSIVRALRFSHAGSLGNFVREAGELFREVCPDDCHATLFVSRYDPVTETLHYVNAGHEAPFILRDHNRRQRIIRLETGGPVLGLVRRPQYRERVLTMYPGDLLVAYTDGVCEATKDGGEEWGWRRFVDSIQDAGRRRARDTVESVWEEMERFTAGVPQFEDMTLWMGRVTEAEWRPKVRAVECEEPVAA
jgi:sigma-B regulation protein RsbU (phosphoserine phosphatase)